MRKRESNVFLVGLSLLLIVLALILVFLKFYNPVLAEREINSSIIVGDRAGFDLTKGVINFGMVFPRGSASRNLILENSYGFKIRVEVIPKGDIGLFLRKEIFYLDGSENKTLGISAIVPEDAPFGNYTGSILVRIKKDI